MVEYLPLCLNRVFAALADPTRRQIMEALTRGSSNVTELAEPFEMSLAAVSKHLRVLERAGLITRTKEGRVHRLRANPKPIEEANQWCARYARAWEDQFTALDDLFSQETDSPSDT